MTDKEQKSTGVVHEKFDVDDFAKYMEEKLLEVKLEINPVVVCIIVDEILNEKNIKHELVIGFKIFPSDKQCLFYTWIEIAGSLDGLSREGKEIDIAYKAILRVDPEIAAQKPRECSQLTLRIYPRRHR